MAIKISAEEVLRLAERIEANGAAFYRRAAELQADAPVDRTRMLHDLAAMEDEHLATFAAMRGELTDRMREETAADPYMEAQLYLNQMADSHGGEGAPSATDALTGQETMAEILKTAIQLEEKSIAFYLGLKDLVPPKLGPERVDAVIAEEKKHVALLAGELKKV